MSETSEGAGLLTEKLDPKQFVPKSTRMMWIGGVSIVVIVAAAGLFFMFGIQSKQEQFLKDLSQRLATLANGRVEVATTWLDGVLKLGDRVVESDFYKLFATEMDLSVGDISALVAPRDDDDSEQDEDPSAPSVSAQIPLMTNVLIEFAQNAGFIAGHLINRDGVTYVTTDSTIVLTDEQIASAKRVYDARKPSFDPVRTTPGGFVMDIYLPIFPPQATQSERNVVGVLMLSTPVTEKVTELATPSRLATEGERIRLVQRTAKGFQELRPGEIPPLRYVTLKIPANAVGMPFALRATIGGEREVYSVALAIPRTSWYLVQEADAESASADVRAFRQTSAIISALVVVAVIVAFGAFWWRLVGDHNRNLATQFQQLAARIASQKRLLDGINDTIADHIGLKDIDGYYLYVNPAFAAAVERDVERVIGLDDEALFGHGTAERLRLSDTRALETGEAVTVDEEIYLQSKKHYMQVSKVPLKDENGVITGIVTVTRDETEMVEQRLKRENAVKQTVIALVRAIELRDPYLGGHSRRVAGFAGAIARQMNAEAEQIATVEIAANLSQIGKLSISRALLNKPERLTDEEMATIQSHVEHASSVLGDLDFGLPVFEAIYQMNERLDGGGYPSNLSGDEISLEGRILAVCDVFCARIEPRSYRPAISAAEAVDILAQNDTRYDLQVVEALRAVVNSAAGEKLIEDTSK